MNFRTALFSSAAVTLLAALCGCAKFEYTGREFAPVPEDIPIAWYTKQSPVPAGKYRIIGRGELSFDSGDMDSHDIEERLLDEARKRGADAVMLQSTTVKNAGSYQTAENMLPAPSSELTPTSALLPNGDPVEVNSFGEVLPLTGETQTQKVVFVRATFYKNSEAVQKLIDEQSIQLLKLEKEQPAGPEKKVSEK